MTETAINNPIMATPSRWSTNSNMITTSTPISSKRHHTMPPMGGGAMIVTSVCATENTPVYSNRDNIDRHRLVYHSLSSTSKTDSSVSGSSSTTPSLSSNSSLRATEATEEHNRSDKEWTHFDDSGAEGEEDTDRREIVYSDGISTEETKNLLEAEVGLPDPEEEEEHVEETFYEIGDEQRRYYSRCFLHLYASTKQNADGDRQLPLGFHAVNGADERVVEFFRRSGLDTASLSQVWSLADINEDGYLDMTEFAIAMHLIVLKVKGHVPIPSILPQPLRQQLGIVFPEDTKTRQNDFVVPLGKAKETATAEWQNLDTGVQPQQFSRSDSNLHHLPPPWEEASSGDSIRQFSDVPPLLVDSRPTPVKTSTTVWPNDTPSCAASASNETSRTLAATPKGPPPRPPPRPMNSRSTHGRSASLDLNNSMCSSASGITMRYEPVPEIGSRNVNVSTNLSARSAAPLLAPSAFSSDFERHQSSPSSKVQAVSAVQRSDVYTQTVEGEELMTFTPEQEQIVHDASIAAQSPSPSDLFNRCTRLRRLNEDLERERVQLAEIRLQLELNLLAESPSGSSRCRPTDL